MAVNQKERRKVARMQPYPRWGLSGKTAHLLSKQQTYKLFQIQTIRTYQMMLVSATRLNLNNGGIRRAIGVYFSFQTFAFLAELFTFRKRQKNRRDGHKEAGIAGCNLCNKFATLS